MTEPVVQTLADVWDSLAQLCADFTPQDWQRPTECPGWSVQDQLAHVVGTETVLMGTPAPEHQLAGPAPHVRNPMGEHNELLVDYRRARAGDEVLAEFRAVTTQRLAELRSLPDEAFDADSWTPIGPGTLRDLVAVRAFDAWVHEQDIRRAVGRPGGLDGAGARHALSRCLSAMPFVVGKKAGAADGQSVLFDIDGEQLAIRVDGGRAKVVPAGELDRKSVV